MQIVDKKDKEAKRQEERTELINNVLEGSIETPGEFVIGNKPS